MIAAGAAQRPPVEEENEENVGNIVSQLESVWAYKQEDGGSKGIYKNPKRGTTTGGAWPAKRGSERRSAAVFIQSQSAALVTGS